MERPAPVDHPVHELICRRWSPSEFSNRPVEAEAIRSLLEAARWAPSSYNEQPWRFIVARQQDPEEFERLLACLVPGNQQWARQAPVLILTVAKLFYDRNGKPNRHAFYDLGQAVACLSLQATALRLFVHQMGGFNVDKARQAYGIPEGFEPVTAVAVGYHSETQDLSEEPKPPEPVPRKRHPLSDFVFSGSWGEVAGFVE